MKFFVIQWLFDLVCVRIVSHSHWQLTFVCNKDRNVPFILDFFVVGGLSSVGIWFEILKFAQETRVERACREREGGGKGSKKSE